MASDVIEDAHVAVQAVFTSPKYSDLTVICGNDNYLLHRAIVCPRSWFINLACDEGFKEASTATISLHGEDPQAVNRMLIYIYTNDYPEEAIPLSQQPTRILPSPKPHLRVSSDRTSAYSSNTKLAMTNLQAESAWSYSFMLSNLQVYTLAVKHNLPGLKTLALQRFQSSAARLSAYKETIDLPTVVRSVFESTTHADCTLRNVIVDLCRENTDAIAMDPVMTEAVQDIGALSFGILSKLSQNKESQFAFGRTSDSDTSKLKAENSRMAEQINKLEATNRELTTAKQLSHTQLKEAISGKEKAIKMKDFAINQRNGVIKERDAALDRYAICVAQLDEYLSNAELLEANTRVFNAIEDDPKSIARAINYCYSLDYNENDDLSCTELALSNPPLTNSESTPTTGVKALAYARLLNNIAAYVVADKYEIAGMMELAKSKAQRAVANSWPPYQFAPLLDTICDGSPAVEMGLREPLVALLVRNCREVLEKAEYGNPLGQHGELAVAVLRKVYEGKNRSR